jgi:predicted GIY-YIG superfamily endonuclease
MDFPLLEIGKKRKFDDLQNRNDDEWFIYVLECVQGKYYVGKTTDPASRFMEHLFGDGSSWTSKYPPVKVITLLKSNGSPDDETNVTYEAMKKYGIENVRGGPFVKMDLPSSEAEVIQNIIRHRSDSCFKCGKKGHFAMDCKEVIEETGRNKTKTHKETVYDSYLKKYFFTDSDVVSDVEEIVITQEIATPPLT